jgi:hypothetical protein
MFDTAESASLWFDIFNGVLLLGAFLVLVGTWGTIKTAAIKEKFSDERTAANEAETKRAVADSDTAKEGTAKANERIAELSKQAEQLRKGTSEANAKAAEAQLALEKYKAPRNLTAAQSKELIDILRPFGPVTYDLAQPQMLEPGSFINFQLVEIGTQLGWKFVSYSGPLPTQPVFLPLGRAAGLSKEEVWDGRPVMGTTSGLIGIKLSYDARYGRAQEIAFALALNLPQYGLYAEIRPDQPAYVMEDGRPKRLPISETMHILIGSK